MMNQKMISKLNVLSKIKVVVTIILLAFFCLSINDVAYSKKKKRSRTKRTRTYNKTKTKAEALAIIQSSEEVAELAGLEVVDTTKASSAYVDLNVDSISIDDIRSSKSDIALLRSYMDTTNSEGEEGENIEELEAEDDVEVNLEDFRSIWLLAMGGSDAEEEKTVFGTSKEELMSIIMDWFGTPYKFGGNTTKSVDCSAWTQQIFHEACQIILPRTAREQIKVGHKVKHNKLEFGDLVFFHTYSRKFASHVGIYLGDNLFAHASSRKGVTVSSLESTFYSKRFIEGRRLSPRDIEHYRIASTDNNKKDF